MDFDAEKIDEAAFPELYLTLHDVVRAWKALGWGHHEPAGCERLNLQSVRQDEIGGPD
jgi:hypothetical protein